jgi:hypothetical protein
MLELNSVNYPTFQHCVAIRRVLRDLAWLPHNLLLTGSLRRGSGGPRSDVDLFLITEPEYYPIMATRILGQDVELTKSYEILCARSSIDGVDVSTRLTSQDVIRRFFDESPPIRIWRDRPTHKSTGLGEYRVNIAGDVTVHDWNEEALDGGWVRTVARFRNSDGVRCPVLTTESSMLFSGVSISSFGLCSDVSTGMRESFGASALSDYSEISAAAFDVLADPRSRPLAS